MTDLLSPWWRIPVAKVERLVGTGATGAKYAAPDASIKARVRYGNKLVRNTAGAEVVSQAQLSMPLDTPRIPAGSRVTVRIGDRARTVIAEERHESGTGLTPDYYSIALD
ncbi:hypothetical protein ACXYTP_23835 [Tsukamurella ocularis]